MPNPWFFTVLRKDHFLCFISVGSFWPWERRRQRIGFQYYQQRSWRSPCSDLEHGWDPHAPTAAPVDGQDQYPVLRPRSRSAAIGVGFDRQQFGEETPVQLCSCSRRAPRDDCLRVRRAWPGIKLSNIVEFAPIVLPATPLARLPPPNPGTQTQGPPFLCVPSRRGNSTTSLEQLVPPPDGRAFGIFGTQPVRISRIRTWYNGCGVVAAIFGGPCDALTLHFSNLAIGGPPRDGGVLVWSAVAGALTHVCWPADDRQKYSGRGRDVGGTWQQGLGSAGPSWAPGFAQRRRDA